MSSAKKQINQYRIIIFILIVVILVMGWVAISFYQKTQQVIEEPIPEEEREIPIKDIDETIMGKIALVIDDFGYRNDEVSDAFFQVGVPLTCAVIPGHEFSQSSAMKAVNEGKEVIIHMPMGTNTPSYGEEEYILELTMTSTEIEKRVIKAIQLLPEAIGMNNHQGSAVTADKRMMNVVGSVLKQNNLFFLDSRTTANTQAEQIMRSLGVPTGRRHVFLDNDSDETLIYKQIAELKKKAHEQGIAIGIGHVKPHTLQVLKEEIPRMKEQNYSFIFVSEVMK